MLAGALAPYEAALGDAGALTLVADSGQRIELEIARWLAPADASDHTVIDRCAGPVLDVGCGPGRFVRALAERGIAALGLDIAGAAVTLTRGRNVAALRRSVFDPAPAEGRWPTVLLMDGNIGIGGDVDRLLRRISGLLAPGGTLLVETARDPLVDRALRVRFGCADGAGDGPSFGWSEVGIDALGDYVEAAGSSVTEIWSAAGRTFAACVRSRTTRTQ
jgi:SAM-dependent methyltransferase